MSQTVVEECFPSLKPGIVLGKITVVRRAVEAKLSMWRRMIFVESSELLAERVGLGYSLSEVIEFAHVEMRV